MLGSQSVLRWGLCCSTTSILMLMQSGPDIHTTLHSVHSILHGPMNSKYKKQKEKKTKKENRKSKEGNAHYTRIVIRTCWGHHTAVTREVISAATRRHPHLADPAVVCICEIHDGVGVDVQRSNRVESGVSSVAIQVSRSCAARKPRYNSCKRQVREQVHTSQSTPLKGSHYLP